MDNLQNQTNKSHIYQIDGMTCSTCGVYIEDTLSKLPDVDSVNVNLATNQCKIVYDDQRLSIKDLNNKIKNAGYKLLPSMSDHSMHNRSKTQEEGGHEMEHEDVDKIDLNMRIGIILMIFSFCMIILDSLMQLMVIPEIDIVIREAIHHFMPIAASYVLFTTGKKYIAAVYNFIISGHANMNTLTGVGVITAYLYSFIITAFEIPLSGVLDVSRNYYDVVVILVVFINYGQFIEYRAKKRTTDAIRKLAEISSNTALVKVGGEVVTKPIEEVVKKDIVVVKVGMSIPVDAVVIAGEGSVNESNLTGESRPVNKQSGNKVYAGTTLENGYIEVEVNGVGKDTKLGRITALVENAMMSKAPMQRLADKISGHFTKFVLVLASICFIGWMIYGYLMNDFSFGVKMAVTTFVSVLVVACPCALGLATPLAITKGIGIGALNGILFKNAESIQLIKDIEVIVFDKTGTLTSGKFEIVEMELMDESQTKEKVDQLIGALESKSNHPIAALFNLGKDIPVKNLQVQNNGIQGEIDGHIYKAGNAKFVGAVENVDTIGTMVYLAENEKILAKYILMDQPKHEVGEILDNLRKRNIKLLLATGDKHEIAKQIGGMLGFRENEIHSQLHPEDKLNLIKSLQAKGKKVAMIGDGVNDSPSLAAADVGIAMGDGSDIALDTAEVAIVDGDISKLPIMISISKNTFNVIKQNLFWAFSYNIVMLPIATGVFYLPLKLLLSPILDAISMSFSSIAVVINSNRIKK